VIVSFSEARLRTRATRGAALLTAVLLVVLVPTASLAAEAGGGRVTWSVVPSDDAGADGRVGVEHEIDPGDSVEDHFAVTNLGEHDVAFRLSAADGYTTKEGHFDMLSSDRKSVDAGTWIDLPETVTVAAGATEVVPFRIMVPEQAEPGDHPAGIAASILSTGTAEDGTGVGIESRMGIQVMTRVRGELTPSVSVDDVSTDYTMSWNPFRPGGVEAEITVTNTGNTRVGVTGTVAIADAHADFPGAGERASVLLPGDTRAYTVRVGDIWPLFVAAGTVTVAPEAVSLDGQRLDVNNADADLIVLAIPIPQLILLAGIGLIVVAVLGGRARSRKRMAGLLAAAREEGRRSARLDEEGEG